MKKFKIDLDTGNRFWTPKGLGAMGMEPSRAIAELVANSLDWRREANDRVIPIINVVIAKTFIRVTDNGVGMTPKELQNAVQVSVANDSVRPNLRVRKGMFGMGMKVACLSLGWKISIVTRPISKVEEENSLIIDSRKLDDEGTTNKYREGIAGNSEKANKNGLLGDWDSGTSITIEDLTHKTLTAVAIRDSLQEIFSPEITAEKVTIEVIDGDTNEQFICKKVIVPVHKESIIDLGELNLFVKDEETNKKVKITGWLGLMKSGASGTGKWGIHLFKNNQVIERFHQLPIRLGGLLPKNPHPMYGRTYGEIHLDMCKPAFHKVGFDYSTNNWKQVQKLLHDHILVIMEQSGKYRAKDYEKAQKSLKEIQKHRKAVKKTIAKIRKDNSKIQDAPENAMILPTGDWFTIVEPIFDNLSQSETNKPWIYHYRKESKELAIIINKDSSIYFNKVAPKITDELVELLVSWAISDCILYVLYETFDFSLKDAISFRDEQLQRLTSEKKEVGDD